MTIYITKVWGFRTPVGPLQFSTLGWRKKALQQLQSGDLVVLVGTMGDQTPDDMKGRLLGIIEPTSEPVSSLDFDVRKSPGHFVDGKYKWPLGLMTLRAWSLPDRPLLSEISNRKFGMDTAQGIVALNDTEAARVRALDRVEEDLLQPTASAQARMHGKHGAAKPTAPPPTTTRRGVMHMRRAPAYTYAMLVVGARPAAFKIGWAFDYKQRARQFNHLAMPDLGGLHYKPHLLHFWDTARQAYAMEQRLLDQFVEQRHSENNEIVFGIEQRVLEHIWRQAVSQMTA